MSKIKSMRIDDISYDIGADYSNIDNVPDLTQKQDTLVSGTNIKTINGQSILGEGNINIEGGSGGGSYMPSISDDALEFLAGSNARVEGEELIF